MQPIPFFGKLNLKGKIQEIQAQKAYQNLAIKINGLRNKIKTVYYDNFYLNSSITITREQLNLIEQWIGQMEAKFKTGQSTYPDLIKAQIAQLKLEDNLKSLLDQRKVLTNKFKALLNKENISIVKTPSTIETEDTDTSRNYLDQIKEYNPELQNSDFTIELKEKTIKLSRLNYYPDFGVGVDYIFTGDRYTSSGTKVSESGKDPVLLKFSLSLPIWWGKNSSMIRTAKFQRLAALDKKQDMENQLAAELSDILNKLEDNYRKIELYQNELIPKSEQLLKVTETAYMNGKSDFLSLIDAQRNHLELELILKKSRADYLKSRADLEKLIGRTL
jgi:outer membrane protein TolC